MEERPVVDVFKVPKAPEPEKSCSIDVDSGSGSSKAQKPDSAKKPLLEVIYNSPGWSGEPPPNFRLEVLKEGAIISNINLRKPFTVFGRLPSCDVQLEHPSSSRYHAVLQYCSGTESQSKGFYLYDLGSVHGTYLNKILLKPHTFLKIEVGHFIKFALSKRSYILQGPEEAELDKTSPADSVKKMKEVEDNSCMWGMAEDAEDEEQMGENPFALSTPNEGLYIDDPKKTLRGWFEREGHELEYDVEEKGFKTFVCHVKLPIDTPNSAYLIVESSVTGKKKEAVVACALEACRTLDRHELLRQSHHESRQRKKKNWEENDYYDSDEDIFFDRTGTIEKKREKRKADKSSKIETNESLNEKLQQVNKQINEIEKKLTMDEHSKSPAAEEDYEIDPLDLFMSEISSSKGALSGLSKKQLRQRMVEFKSEQKRLERWCNLTKNVQLPKLVPQSNAVASENENFHSSEDSFTETRVQKSPRKFGLHKITGACPERSSLPVESLKPDELISKEQFVLDQNSWVPESFEMTDKVIEPPVGTSADAKSDVKRGRSGMRRKRKTGQLIGPQAKVESVGKRNTRDGKDTDEKKTDENYSMWLPPVNEISESTWKSALNSKLGY